jgi:hypothetical protein
MKKLLVLILLIVCGFSKEKTYSDHQVKQLTYQNKLTKAQIYTVLNGQLKTAISIHKSKFNCSERDLRIATVAVICLETGNLKSKSVMVNNLFGIKKVKGRPDFTMKTNEYNGKKMIRLDQQFASFFSITDCINGFYTFLSKDRYNKVRKAGNYKTFLKEMVKAGYATDPSYTDKILRIAREIEETTK